MSGLTTLILGIFVLIYGLINSMISFINLGMACVLISIILVSMVPQKMMDREIHNAITKSNVEFLRKLFLNLDLKGHPLYIPPNSDLKCGAIFVPAKKNFKINLSAYSQDIVFITNQSSSSEMGVLITPPIGYELLKIYEETYGKDILELESSVLYSLLSNVLYSMDLLTKIDFEDVNNGKISIKLNKRDFKDLDEYFYLLPIVSSIILAISKSKNKIIIFNELVESKNDIEILLSEIGECYEKN